MIDQLARLQDALADRYAIERELGQGGMATVYLAEDLKHHRKVALKALRLELAASLGGDRFLREIETTAQLTHPHILPLLDSGAAGGTLFYVMPFVEGESLRDRLTREKQLPLEDALRIAREVADALSYAHAHGVVHRDIKPENILLQSGHAVVADFGIARAVSAAGSTRLTETGLAVGTPQYMSPEQAAGSQDLDGRSDLYSLGCVLYEMLGGEAPYMAPTPQALIAKKLSEPTPRISVVRESVPSGVEAALNKALSKTPADRFSTAADFAAALAHPDTLSGPIAAVPRRRWGWNAMYVGAGVIAALLLAVGLLVVRRGAAGGATRCASGGTLALAVLPFDVGGDTANTYFADGLTDELAGALGKVPGLRVTGRTSSYAFKGQSLDAQTVGRRLGVTHLVEASVRRAGSLVRVQAQLVCAADGFVLWSAPYEREVRDVFAVQDSVTAAIVGELRLHLTGATIAATRAGRTDNPEAHDLYLQGMFLWRRATPSDFDNALGYFQRALRQDSTYALAWTGIALVWMGRSVFALVDPRTAAWQINVAVERALALDSTLAEVQYVAGNMHAFEWDYAGAEHAYQRAIAINPGSADAHMFYAGLLYLLGRFTEGRHQIERAIELDPLNPLFRGQYGAYLFLARQFADALRELNTAMQMTPDQSVYLTTIWDVLWQLGRHDEALAALRKGYAGDQGLQDALTRGFAEDGYQGAFRRLAMYLGARKPPAWSSSMIAEVYMYAGEKDSAFAWLDRGYRIHEPDVPGNLGLAAFDAVRSDPRFLDLCRRGRLPTCAPSGARAPAAAPRVPSSGPQVQSAVSDTHQAPHQRR